MTTSTKHQSPPADITFDEVEAFILDAYISLRELSRRAEVSAERILELEAAGCIPPRAYEVRGGVTVNSAFGDHPLALTTQRYYHPDMVVWLTKAVAFATDHALEEVAVLMREDFERLLLEALGDRPMPWQDGTDHAWTYWMDGSFSLCLHELSPRSVVEKEVARWRIRNVDGSSAGNKISLECRNELNDAIAQYNTVATAFAPHERAQSSRHLEVEAVSRKFGL